MEPPRAGPCRARDVGLLKALLAEFLGTGIFLFAGLASITPWTQPAQSQAPGAGSEPSGTASSAPTWGREAGPQAPCRSAPPNPLHVSLAFGSSVALMSYWALPLSGGHLNPAVTVSMLVAVKVRPAWAVGYILAQLLGGIAASALLYGLTPAHARGEMGVNKLAPGVALPQALGVEAIVSFQLVLSVLATARSEPDPSKGGHLLVGLSVTLGHLVAIGYTGCGMNPARSLGPALITFEFAHHWVFWLGPLGGGLAAAVLTELLRAPTGRGFRQWLTMLLEGPKDEHNPPSKADSTTHEMGLSEMP